MVLPAKILFVFGLKRTVISTPFSRILLLYTWADVVFVQGLFINLELIVEDLRNFLEKIKEFLRKILELPGRLIALIAKRVFPEVSFVRM